MDFIVRGKYLLTDASKGDKGVIEQGGVLISGDKIKETGKFDVLRRKFPKAEIKGGPDKLVMPGLIDAHSHGQGLSVPQRGKKYDFLENYMMDGPPFLNLDPELESMVCAIAHLKNGCTTLHHNAIRELFDHQTPEKVILGYQKAGIRLAYSPGMRNVNVIAYDDEAFYSTLPQELQKLTRPIIFNDKEKMVEEYFELFDHLYRTYNSENLKIFFGPTWAQGATDDYLVKVSAKAHELGGLPIHIHTLQTPLQKAFGLRKYGKSLLEHMKDLGLVRENLVLGHAVFLNESDIEILASSHASITSHPSCNFSVRNGIAPVYYLHKAGVNVALGIDDKGFNDDNDPFVELRMLNYLHRVPGFDLVNTPALTSSDILAMGTLNAARVTGFNGIIGALNPGMKADLLVLSLKNMMESPWTSALAKISDIIIQRGKGSDVETVIVGGKIIIESGEFVSLDVDAIFEEAREQAEKGPSKSQIERQLLMDKIRPYYQDWYKDWIDYDVKPFYPINSRF